MKTKDTSYAATAKLAMDDKRIDALKERQRSTPQELDFERIRIMKEVYEETTGDVQILRRAKFLAAMLERKKIFIDDNPIVGNMAGSYMAIYPNPEWNINWMREEKTVENSKTEEDREAKPVGTRLLGQAGPEEPDRIDLQTALRL